MVNNNLKRFNYWGVFLLVYGRNKGSSDVLKVVK